MKEITKQDIQTFTEDFCSQNFANYYCSVSISLPPEIRTCIVVVSGVRSGDILGTPKRLPKDLEETILDALYEKFQSTGILFEIPSSNDNP
ncbi:hypothetical protein CO112_00360 [Candidatus Dojkabacteria bacterium CG_4_9_14_3_um_filter_150_Dojkabacteria_WS6_41_13]|uniref:Uncharacterized protein n=1 Tax=Candidatus Dojkabacteria bacterium CG_4_10_14_0_2_um_filter_Dojkabacteria_WS6_41_15 TaxID=2014249 RepID=A0A2M7W1F3_9BACT|nr:MAG: hypothetical protein COX64_03870 [Candidatus Dojkabacteria bacterium CG_4_10_14_0_2_um_filter_Dojkabacteria_WS6_41_15]PJB23748.1 MAG: hypothetical protein CO112_00360 [Candidatus Dojkabacteria bacterium CG_4_9_14_3_um_filter_150_Dojkabacteria_WS6_41_13]